MSVKLVEENYRWRGAGALGTLLNFFVRVTFRFIYSRVQLYIQYF